MDFINKSPVLKTLPYNHAAKRSKPRIPILTQFVLIMLTSLFVEYKDMVIVELTSMTIENLWVASYTHFGRNFGYQEQLMHSFSIIDRYEHVLGKLILSLCFIFRTTPIPSNLNLPIIDIRVSN